VSFDFLFLVSFPFSFFVGLAASGVERRLSSILSSKITASTFSSELRTGELGAGDVGTFSSGEPGTGDGESGGLGLDFIVLFLGVWDDAEADFLLGLGLTFTSFSGSLAEPLRFFFLTSCLNFFFVTLFFFAFTLILWCFFRLIILLIIIVIFCSTTSFFRDLHWRKSTIRLFWDPAAAIFFVGVILADPC